MLLKAGAENTGSPFAVHQSWVWNGAASNQAITVKQRAPLSSISHILKQSQMCQAVGFNPAFQPARFPGSQPGFASQNMNAAFASSSAPLLQFQHKRTRVVRSIQLL